MTIQVSIDGFRHVILSAAKNPYHRGIGFFAALRMTWLMVSDDM